MTSTVLSRTGYAAGIEAAAKVADERAAICEDAVKLIGEGKLYRGVDGAAATEGCAALEARHIATAIRALAATPPAPAIEKASGMTPSTEKQKREANEAVSATLGIYVLTTPSDDAGAKFGYECALAAIRRRDELQTQVIADAQRWRALMECARIRMQGSAGDEDVEETCRLVEYDMAHRGVGEGDAFVAERREVAKVIQFARAALACEP